MEEKKVQVRGATYIVTRSTAPSPDLYEAWEQAEWQGSAPSHTVVVATEDYPTGWRGIVTSKVTPRDISKDQAKNAEWQMERQGLAYAAIEAAYPELKGKGRRSGGRITA